MLFLILKVCFSFSIMLQIVFYSASLTLSEPHQESAILKSH